MELDINGIYLLARPRGGLNDFLVQIEKCRRYAARHGRTLILDMSRSTLREPFGAVFRARGDFGCGVIHWDPAEDAALDRFASVRPPEVAGRLSSYEARFNRKRRQAIDKESRAATTFDMRRPYPENLLLHEQPGSGVESFYLLRDHLRLAPDVAEAVARRLVALGTGYDAIHIRHSDYKTDFERFLRRIQPALEGRRILICSDSAEVKEAAARILRGSEVVRATETPDLAGAPLHRTPSEDVHQLNIDLLTDLLAMARADRFAYAPLSTTGKAKTRFSGFSRLAHLLQRNDAVVGNLLRNAGAELPDQLRAPSDASKKKGTLGLWRRNFDGAFDAWRTELRQRAVRPR